MTADHTHIIRVLVTPLPKVHPEKAMPYMEMVYSGLV